ncbi:MAG: TonB-dependent receptor [Rhodothermales bacterium]
MVLQQRRPASDAGLPAVSFARYALLAALFLLFVGTARAQELSAELRGFVTDSYDGLPLEGATVALTVRSATTLVAGAVTDRSGNYRITGLHPGRYTIVIRYVGYEELRRSIVLEPGQARTMDVPLQQTSIDLNTVVVSASRQQELALETASSISVVADREVQADVTPSAASLLRDVAGVDYAQTGLDRREVALRGFNNSIIGETYVLTDHRASAVPGLALNAYGLMPIASLDVDRIEVVRGSGSTLYGAGVDQGLIHFVTKDPFAYQGTSFSTGGGGRGLMDLEFRHADAVSRRFAYKVVGEYARGEDWELDPDDALDRSLILAEGGALRDAGYWKYNLNAQGEYRFAERARLSVNTGYLSQKMAMLTGIGAAQTDNFAYGFAQVRLNAGPLFAQVYLNQNNSGDSYYYRQNLLEAPDSALAIVDKTRLVGAQINYDLNYFNGRGRMVVGSDLRWTQPRTEGTVYGRFENADDIGEAGVFAQSTTRVSPALDLLLAVRADYNTIAEHVQYSPRAGFVYKISPQQTFRLTLNQAYSAPGLNPYFLDLQIRQFPTAAPFNLAYQAQGAVHGFTFDDYRAHNSAAFLLPDEGDLAGAPGVFGQMVPVDRVPLVPVYQAFSTGLAAALADGTSLPAPLNAMTADQRAQFAALLGQLAPFVDGYTAGRLGLPDNSTDGFRAVSGPVDVAPLKQSLTRSVEAGYKGVITPRFILSVDAYLTRKENFVGPLLIESPMVYLTEVDADLARALEATIADIAEANPGTASFLDGLGLDAAEAAGLLGQLARDGYGDVAGFGASPVAVVQPDQATLPDGSPATSVGGLLTYRNFGRVDLWGTDIDIDWRATDRLRTFAHASFLSDNFFDYRELGEDDPALEVPLNAPKFKFGAGASYAFPFGFSARAAVRHVGGFPVRTGPFIGDIEAYTVVDLTAGFDFGRTLQGLRLDATIQNALTIVDGQLVERHREFAGAPRIGRLAMARLVYTF